jgi:hypothetical protein
MTMTWIWADLHGFLVKNQVVDERIEKIPQKISKTFMESGKGLHPLVETNKSQP